MSAEIPSRELRNDTAGVLRRIESGESLDVTVRGRPVARLSPARARPTAMPWNVFWQAVGAASADAGLVGELAEILPDTTDDVGP